MLRLLLVTFALVALVLPTPAGAQRTFFDSEKDCDKETRICRIPYDMLEGLVMTNGQMEETLARAGIVLQAQTARIQALEKELGSLREAKGCAKVEVRRPLACVKSARAP